MRLSRIRKAVVAFLTPIMGLPIVAWIDTTDTVAFSLETFLMTVGAALIQAVLVWRVPNAE